MIVIVAQFCTDGDYRVDAEQAGLVVPPEGYDYCGTFLCADVEEAETVLERLSKSVNSADSYLYRWFTRTFGEAFRILQEEPESLRFGWAVFLEGNYTGTHLFMQTV